MIQTRIGCGILVRYLDLPQHREFEKRRIVVNPYQSDREIATRNICERG
jgi:hypothetical protein